jgi:hypothetical protein
MLVSRAASHVRCCTNDSSDRFPVTVYKSIILHSRHPAAAKCCYADGGGLFNRPVSFALHMFVCSTRARLRTAGELILAAGGEPTEANMPVRPLPVHR